MLRRFIVFASLVMGLLSPLAEASEFPELGYQAVPGFFKLPAGMNFGEVAGVALNSKGHVFVFHRGKHPLMEFDSQGNYLKHIGDDLFENAHGLRIDEEDNIWTTDVKTHLVLKLSPDGKVLLVLGKRGMAGEWIDKSLEKVGAKDWADPSNMALFDKPSDLAFDTEGNIFVADGYGNSRVMKFDKDGTFLTTWGVKGTGTGEFILVHAIAVDSKNRVYVADRENARIQIFDANGRHLKTWSHVGYPYGLRFSSDGSLFMTDARAERVIKLNQDGGILAYLGEPGKLIGQFGWAHGIAVGPNDEIYVTEILNWRVQKFVFRN